MELVNFKEELYKNLRDPDYAVCYLQGAYEDSLDEFYQAIRDLVIAHGGVQSVSKKIHRSRRSLYKSLSRDGHPKFETIPDVLRSIGFNLSVTTVSAIENELRDNPISSKIEKEETLIEMV